MQQVYDLVVIGAGQYRNGQSNGEIKEIDRHQAGMDLLSPQHICKSTLAPISWSLKHNLLSAEYGVKSANIQT